MERLHQHLNAGFQRAGGSALFVTAYAKKVKDGKGSILTAEQISECKAAYGTSTEISSNVRLTGRQKGVLIVFAFSFLIMILGFIPWGSLNEGIYNALGFTRCPARG